ncbi:USP6 N-terminal-like protein [Ptychodera flava]|uniref:USP6 N-terminal-like protein n=1 Tax=Ptychodera flava TaxID=63121 RepID=UPI003969E60C
MENPNALETPAIPEDVQYFDSYGFAAFKPGCVVDLSESQRCHEYSIPEHSQYQLNTWRDMLSEWETTWRNSPNKLRNYIKRGVPNGLRGVLWKNLLESDKIKCSSGFNYMENLLLVRSQLVDLGVSEYGDSKSAMELHTDEFLEEHKDEVYDMKTNNKVPISVLRQIFLDVERTFPTHQMFMGRLLEAKEGRASLFRVLSVYARYNPTVGYCQGMSYIVAMFLMHMNEENAFWSIVSLFERPKYLYGYFEHDMNRIQKHAAIFHKLMHQRFPKLTFRLDCQGLFPLMFVTQWFLCLYTSLPCWDTVLAIWDLILLDGFTVIFRVGLAILQLHSDDLLQTKDMNCALPKLLRPPMEIIKYDVFMPVLWNTEVHKWEIDTLLAVLEEEDLKKNKSGSKRQLRNTRVEFVEESPHLNKKRKLSDDETDSTSLFSKFVNIFTPTHQRSQSKTNKQPKAQLKGGPGKALPTISNTQQSGTRMHSYYLRNRANHSEHSIQRHTSGPCDDMQGKENHMSAGQRSMLTDEESHLSPCEIASEHSFVTPTASPSTHHRHLLKPHRRLSASSPSRGLRHSPRLVAQNGKSTAAQQTPSTNQCLKHSVLNIPSSRKIVSSRARTQYSFRAFNTQTPLRQSQMVQQSSESYLSSPEVELQPMNLQVIYKSQQGGSQTTSPLLEQL